jgi:transposase
LDGIFGTPSRWLPIYAHCEYYRDEENKTSPSKHRSMWARRMGIIRKDTIIDPKTEKSNASVFVAILPASNYTYAEAQASENQCNWNNGHVRAFEFFGGVVQIVVPDNLKTGVQKPNYYEPDINPAYQELAEHYQFAVLPA